MVTMKLDDEIAAVLAASGRTDQVLAPPVSDLPTLRVTGHLELAAHRVEGQVGLARLLGCPPPPLQGTPTPNP